MVCNNALAERYYKNNVEEDRIFIEGNGNPRSYAGRQPPSIKIFYLQNNYERKETLWHYL